jgi:tRNA (Thr-GGU) A37 N-methylase
MRALDGVNTRSLAVSGVDLFHGSNVLDLRMGTVQGIYSWVSTLVMEI